MKHTLLLLLLLNLILANLMAQQLSFTEERAIDFNKDYLLDGFNRSDITIDHDGNKIITGGFDGSQVDFGSFDTLSSKENRNIFIVKYNDNNEVQWKKNIGGSIHIPSFSTTESPSNDYASSIKIDSENNIYVLAIIDVGTIKVVDLDAEHATTNSIIPTSRTDPFSSTNETIYIIKYSPDGVLLWYREVENTAPETGLKLCIDGNDNVWATGFLGGGYEVTDFDISNTYDDDRDLLQNEFLGFGFMVNYNSDGDFLNVYGIGEGYSVITDLNVTVGNSGNVYLSGSFSGVDTQFFKNKENPFVISTLGKFEFGPANQDAFVLKMNVLGEIEWFNTISSTTTNRSLQIAIDDKEDVYVAGYITGSADFDRNSTATTDVVNAVADGSAFIAKYNTTDGSLNWVEKINGGTFSAIRDLAINGDELIVCGQFDGSITIGSTALNATITNPFIAILDTDGNWLRAGHITKTKFSSSTNLALANDGTIHYLGFETDRTEFTHNVKGLFLGKVDDIILNLDEESENMQASIYPNPASDIVNTKIGQLEIIDMFGNLVLSEESTGKVDVSSLTKGIYFALQNGKKTKLIIE